MLVANSLDKQAIAKAFNRAAHHYDHYANLQRDIGNHLIDFMQPTLQANNRSLLDAGCGTGFFSRYWQNQGYTVTALDIASNMLEQAKFQQSATHYIAGDIESLSFNNQLFDIVFSNLAIQWCRDFKQAINELCRVNKKCVAFTTLIDGSLNELNQCRLLLNHRHKINTFLPLETILEHCSDQPLQWQIKQHQLQFDSLMPLLQSLKGIGANYIPNQTDLGLTSRKQLQQLEDLYLKNFGRFSLSYSIFYGVITHE